MTRDQIAEDLLELVLRIGNELPAQYDEQRAAAGMPASVREAEWAYVKGLASHGIMQLRDRFLQLPPASTLATVLEQSGESRLG
jgi:hypothetical protein